MQESARRGENQKRQTNYWSGWKKNCQHGRHDLKTGKKGITTKQNKERLKITKLVDWGRRGERFPGRDIPASKNNKYKYYLPLAVWWSSSLSVSFEVSLSLSLSVSLAVILLYRLQKNLSNNKTRWTRDWYQRHLDAAQTNLNTIEGKVQSTGAFSVVNSGKEQQVRDQDEGLSRALVKHFCDNKAHRDVNSDNAKVVSQRQ